MLLNDLLPNLKIGTEALFMNGNLAKKSFVARTLPNLKSGKLNNTPP
jgi:hypothetical protein